MTDMIVKGTGNSRFLRSAIPADITFSQFVALLREGALPIDLAGLNDDGVEVKGTPLGKGTLLSDATETAIWGDAADRTVDEALRYSFSALMDVAGEKATVVTGTYSGDGTETRTFSLGFTPRVLLLYGTTVKWGISGTSALGHLSMCAIPGTNTNIDGDNAALEITNDGFTVTQKAIGVSHSNANYSNRVFMYIAII